MKSESGRPVMRAREQVVMWCKESNGMLHTIGWKGRDGMGQSGNPNVNPSVWDTTIWNSWQRIRRRDFIKYKKMADPDNFMNAHPSCISPQSSGHIKRYVMWMWILSCLLRFCSLIRAIQSNHAGSGLQTSSTLHAFISNIHSIL